MTDMDHVKSTRNILRVYAALLGTAAPERHYALELSQHTDISIGSIYAVLTRLERAGIVTSEVEGTSPHLMGRPQRRYYTLTEPGAGQARTAVQTELGAFTALGWLDRMLKILTGPCLT